MKKRILSCGLAFILLAVTVLVYLPVERASASSYDAGKAIEYAHKYWQNYNNRDHWNYEWTLGGSKWWGGSTRRVTILITDSSSDGCSCSESYSGDYVVSTSSLPLTMRINSNSISKQCNK